MERNSKEDMVNHPKHYTSNPFGIETIEITKHYNFCVGNALKYILRAGLKWNAIEDLKKAVWYLNQEIKDRLQQRQINANQIHVNEPSFGVEIHEITKHYNDFVGTALECIFNVGLKYDSVYDLETAVLKLNQEINRRESESKLDDKQ